MNKLLRKDGVCGSPIEPPRTVAKIFANDEADREALDLLVNTSNS